MCIALRRLLCPRGYEVVTFSTGEELLDGCGRQAVACIILDLHMPGMSGFDVIERLSRQNTFPPVIVITGHDQKGNAERLLDMGASAYFTKPVDGEPLLKTLSDLVTATGQSIPAHEAQ